MWIIFLKKKTLFNSESVFDDKKGYEMLPMKIFQKNIQTRDLFSLEPEVPNWNVIICCKLKENNTKIRRTACNR